MKTAFKSIALIFAILFLWAAFVQWNDPDAVLWYLVYGLASLASIFFFFSLLPFTVYLVLFLLYFIGALICWPESFEGISIGEGDIANIESGREALGLLIAAMAMLLYAWRTRAVLKSKV